MRKNNLKAHIVFTMCVQYCIINNREARNMAKTENLNIRIEPEIKREAEDTLKYLGLTMAEAVKIFLKQVIITDGIPFEIKKPKYNKETLEAIEEAKRIAKDPKAKKYETIEELMEDLEN